MRDTNEEMVQIMGAVKENGAYGCETQFDLNGEILQVRFGTSEKGYMLLKRILSFQPFESVSSGKYSYFFSGSYRPSDKELLAGIRVEQGNRHKKFWLELTPELNANFLWLMLVKEKSQVEQFLSAD